MCGIAGLINFERIRDADETTVRRMMTLLRHRGPDECGLYRDQQACLGHTRLSIIGLSTGQQPLANVDESLWIVFNGEIFNYIELKAELIQKGYRFRTDSDTEVLLACYEEYGSDCLSLLNGQFAFAIWDVRKRQLFLARDRVGIRPLYYYQSENSFHFASEIKAIFADPGIARSLDPVSLNQIFTFWTTLSSRTVFAGIKELPPGNYMVVSDGGIQAPQPYWSIPYYQPSELWRGTFDEAKEELVGILNDAIALRLRADVPVGAYLSGGLDSSIITSVIAKNFNNHLRTFSLAFEENPFDESAYQAELVRQLGTEHSEIKVANSAIRDNLPQVVWQCEKPLVRTGPVPLFSLSRLVRENNFKVVLTGEGADEVFGGYNIFKEAKLRAFWGRQPESKWRPLLVERLYPYIFKDPARARAFLQQFFAVSADDLTDPFFSHQVRWRNSGKNSTFFTSHVQSQIKQNNDLDELRSLLPDGFSQRDTFSKAQLLEMEIFLSNYLLSSQGDRVGMGNSIELRLPFLDYRVIDFAARLPAHWKIKGLNEKYLLKEAYKQLLPASISKRPKQPYRAPIREAFPVDEPGSYIAEQLSDAKVFENGYFDVKKVNLLKKRFSQGAQQSANEVQNMALMGILTTQLLHQQFIEDFDPVKIEPANPDKRITRHF